MKANLPKPGCYVIAVSGGLDSVCLLNLMVSSGRYRLIVAHFDHGIRSDSSRDLEFVLDLAGKYKLEFVSAKGELGPEASEARARRARYDFLRQVLQETKAEAIVTAHHQDDRLETVIINLIRGTGRLGLGPISETKDIKRPFLALDKQQLRDYAYQQNLSWREDSTNQDDRYLRNYIRLYIIPRLDLQAKQQLIAIMDQQTKVNIQIDRLIYSMLECDDSARLSRQVVNSLSYNESKELIASWLRYNNLVSFDRRMIDRLTIAIKTKRPGVKLDVYDQAQIIINKEFLALNTIER